MKTNKTLEIFLPACIQKLVGFSCFLQGNLAGMSAVVLDPQKPSLYIHVGKNRSIFCMKIHSSKQ